MKHKKVARKESIKKPSSARDGASSSVENSQAIVSDGERLVYRQDGMPHLEVLLEDETIWITQKQMAELFGCSTENIRLHVRNIYDIGELEEASTSKEFLEVRLEGSRRVTRRFAYYNLDMAISVGYRVNTIRGVRFRQWATRVLMEYLRHGSVRDRRITKLEKRMSVAERSLETIVYTLMPPLKENRRRIGFHP